jgi:hypothetical protein
MEVALWRRATAAVGAWTPEQRDTVVYATAAAFALGTMRFSSIALYRQWGEVAIGPYVFGTLASLMTVRRARRRPVRVATGNRLRNARVAIFLFVLAGSALLPLSLEVFLQSQSGGTTHVQPEVLVVERSGTLVAHLKDPYSTVTGKRLTGAAAAELRGQPAYDQYDPYGPLMALFGIPSSLHAPPRLTDARLYFSLVALLLVAVALALCRGSSEPRFLALQGMTVLPIAALPMATAGDDLPVAAVLLLGMFLLHRRRALAGGLILGFAAGQVHGVASRAFGTAHRPRPRGQPGPGRGVAARRNGGGPRTVGAARVLAQPDVLLGQRDPLPARIGEDRQSRSKRTARARSRHAVPSDKARLPGGAERRSCDRDRMGIAAPPPTNSFRRVPTRRLVDDRRDTSRTIVASRVPPLSDQLLHLVVAVAFRRGCRGQPRSREGGCQRFLLGACARRCLKASGPFARFLSLVVE